jgi:RNA polymerase sigma-70 factor (ECF subfamily)
VHGYLSRRLMPRHDLVEDLFQQVFLEAWQNLERFRGSAGVRTWLMGIARHKVQDHYRSRLREFQIDEDAPEPADPVDLAAVLEQQVSREKVWRVMSELGEEARVLLLWRYWEGWSAEAMAASSGKTAKGIERSLARAREQFKRRWYSENRQQGGIGDE